jgi:DNA-binding transcriptional LysR family regulator
MSSDHDRGKAPDWNDVRFFLALARERTLAKAARVLRVDQTTVGRRMAALEARVGVPLFVRNASGFDITPAGQQVLEAAQRMSDAAFDFSAVLASGARCRGTVEIATTESLAEHFIIPALVDLHGKCPEIAVVLRTGWTRVDLRRGEADLAVRLVRPKDPSFACQKLGEFSHRLYASKEYVARAGVPASLSDHPLVGYEDALRFGGSVFTSLQVQGGRVAMQANSGHVLLTATVAGLGIAQLPSFMGDGHAGLVQVLPEYEKAYAVWLVIPQSKRHVASVRAVCDAVARAFRRKVSPASVDRAAG